MEKVGSRETRQCAIRRCWWKANTENRPGKNECHTADNTVKNAKMFCLGVHAGLSEPFPDAYARGSPKPDRPQAKLSPEVPLFRPIWHVPAGRYGI